MSGINTETAMRLLKTRLNRLPADTTLDEMLEARIDAAVKELEGIGIKLQDTADDLMLVVDSAAWAYSNRDQATGMPEWLRIRRRERWLRERDT